MERQAIVDTAQKDPSSVLVKMVMIRKDTTRQNCNYLIFIFIISVPI